MLPARASQHFHIFVLQTRLNPAISQHLLNPAISIKL